MNKPQSTPEHPHLIDGEFQSDKYPSTPRGCVPLKCSDPDAQPLLWRYAQIHREKDPQFSEDLETALKNRGYSGRNKVFLIFDGTDEMLEALKGVAEWCGEVASEEALKDGDKPLARAHSAISHLIGGLVEEEEQMKHIDDFIDDLHSDAYAAWVFSHFRLPAIRKARLQQFMRDHRLFCTYEGKRWRVTGASRMGDVWLSEDFNREIGYELRVDVNECSNWSPAP